VHRSGRKTSIIIIIIIVYITGQNIELLYILSNSIVFKNSKGVNESNNVYVLEFALVTCFIPQMKGEKPADEV